MDDPIDDVENGLDDLDFHRYFSCQCQCQHQADCLEVGHSEQSHKQSHLPVIGEMSGLGSFHDDGLMVLKRLMGLATCVYIIYAVFASSQLTRRL